jgi:hypothetical protein
MYFGGSLVCFECEVKTSLYSSRRLLGFLGKEVNLEFLGEEGN